ncbi:MAG TPA: formyltransferase family protein [Casimicrobiaceae bacterium]|nr:formyltransferase family protein [Casimicrobiaceae bacterium]
MNITLVGSRYFGAAAFDALRSDATILQVAVPAPDDRLATAANAAGASVCVLADARIVPGDAIPDGTDLIVAAHTHARVSDDALARSRLRGIGYHPSLLPRHRGIAAIEWTILCGDPIAGGSVYHLEGGWDRGAIAAQDWCFVLAGETARGLWERALAPMGLALLSRVVRDARDHGVVPSHPQDERFATKAPLIRVPIASSDERGERVSLYLAAFGADRVRLAELLSERAQAFGANWNASRMMIAGNETAAIVHVSVPTGDAEALVQALQGLESSGLRVARL